MDEKEKEKAAGPEAPTRWELFLFYGDLALQSAGGILNALAAGLSLCLAGALTNHITQSRLSSLDETPVEALALIAACSALVLILMIVAVFKGIWERNDNIYLILSSIAGTMLMFGMVYSLFGSYKERIGKSHPVGIAMPAAINPLDNLAKHPELTDHDARVIALAQAIKNIMINPDRLPCAPAPSPTPSPKPVGKSIYKPSHELKSKFAQN